MSKNTIKIPKKDKVLTKKESVKIYRKLSKLMDRLNVAACQHISRKDNNQVFEIGFFFKDIAKRIDSKYPETDYPRLLK